MKTGKKLIIIIILLLISALWGEGNRLELERRIMKAMGREKVDLLLELSKLLLTDDITASWEADSLALKLSRETRYTQGESKALTIAGRIQLTQGDYWQAIDCFEKALKLVDAESEQLNLGMINANIALAYNKLGWADKAIDKLKESEAIYKSLEMTPEVIEELARCYRNRGTIDLERGRFEEALASFLKAMQEAEKIKEPALEATLKGYIGRVYQSLMNPALSLEYYRQALQVHQEMNNRKEVAVVYGNMGTLYAEMEDYTRALEYYEKSLEEYRSLDDDLGIASVLGNIGNLYYYQKDYQKTLEYYQQTLEIFKAQGVGMYQAYLTNNMGMIYLEMGDFTKAETAIKQALAYAEEFKSQELKAEINASLSELYRAKGDAELALQYKEKESNLRDSIFASTTAEQIAEMQTKYNTERKERENVLLRKDNEIKELEITRKEMQRNYMIALAFAVLLLVAFVYRRYRSKKKSAEILAAKNTLITRQKEELSETLGELRKTQKKLVESEKMASLGSLVTGVAHEINTPVGIIITAASNLCDRQKTLMEKYQNNQMKKSDLDTFLGYIEKAGNLILSNSQRTGELVKSFKQVSVDQSTEAQRQFKIRNYIRDVLTSLEPKFKGRKVEVKINCDEFLVWNSYPGIFAQIITNLVLNSLVHAFGETDEGEIAFNVVQSDKRLYIEYYDDGKGMAGEVLKKIFDPFFTTNKQTGTGLGMHIIYNLVTQKLNGNIIVESEPGKGARFKMDFPYAGGGLSEL
ncbi:MAG: tetratricopeptide repeat protein [Candidatus Cloacimonetes bacterium]|nr:tetratricopeptide repeat protein [Candidatus Cloacimonadota bacterium]